MIEYPADRMRQLRAWAFANARCDADAVGAAFYRDNSALVVGFNGPPIPLERCADLGCDWVPVGVAGVGRTHARHLHAEVSAIAKAAEQGIALRGSEVMVTRAPCPSCALALIAARVSAIYMPARAIPDGWDIVKAELVSVGIVIVLIDDRKEAS